MTTKKFSPGDSRTTEVTGQAGSGDWSKEIDVGQYEYVGLQTIFTGLDAGDGTIDILGSVDGTNFDSYPSALTTIASGGSAPWWDIHTRSLEKLKVVWSHGANTTGSFDVVSRKEVPAV